MVRVKRGITSHARHKKILNKAKGYYGSRSKSFRSANQAVIKAHQYSYRDRKQKKRNFRKLWIIKINAEVRKYGFSYSKFINKIKKYSLDINRKMLADIIKENNESFKNIIKIIQK